jgi:hypothetical protein
MKASTKVQPIYFDPQKLGGALKEVGIDYTKVESREIETRWFRDDSGDTDVFIWLNKEKSIIKQQTSIMGQLVEWNIIEGLKTGMIMEDEILKSDQKDQLPQSELIYFDKIVQQQAVLMANNVIQYMTIDVELKSRLLKNFAKDAPLGLRLFQTGLPTADDKKSFISVWIQRIIGCFRK